MLPGQEKRRIIRWKVQRPMRFKLPDQEEEKIALLRDISFFGAQASLLESLRLQDKLNLVLEIPDEQDTISCEGKVVWQKAIEEEGKHHFICGLSFTKIADHDKDKIFRHIWQTSPEDLKHRWYGDKK